MLRVEQRFPHRKNVLSLNPYISLHFCVCTFSSCLHVFKPVSSHSPETSRLGISLIRNSELSVGVNMSGMG